MASTEDRFSDLPDEIIHHILSYLPMKDAAQTTVLSRRWKHIWNSYPDFDFCQNSLFHVDPHGLFQSQLDDGISKQRWPRYWETLEKLTNIVDRKLEKFSEYKIGIQKFKLSVALVDQEFHSCVDKWMEIVSEKHVKELDLCIMAAGKYYYVFPETTFAAKSLTVLKIRGYHLFLEDPFVESVVNLHSLRILSLENVYIDEKTTQNLISSCPYVEDLSLSFSEHTLQSLNIYGLVKLVNLTVNVRGRCLKMKFSGCQGLQRVSLHQAELDCVFDDANFPQIKFISLSRSILGKGFKISSHQLKTLIIRDCYKKELNICAPNLISVHHGYNGTNRTIYLPFLNDHCKLQVEMFIGRVPLYTPWYTSLKEYLQNQKQIKTLQVSFNADKVEFHREEVEKGNWLWPPPALMCLTIDPRLVPSDNYAAMMDGFFWCCRPQVLSSNYAKDFVEFLFKMLSDREDKGCCGSSEMKCWRHSLKKVSDFVTVEHNGIEEKVPFCWDTF